MNPITEHDSCPLTGDRPPELPEPDTSQQARVTIGRVRGGAGDVIEIEIRTPDRNVIQVEMSLEAFALAVTGCARVAAVTGPARASAMIHYEKVSS
jgi:hypothetical protein